MYFQYTLKDLQERSSKKEFSYITFFAGGGGSSCGGQIPFAQLKKYPVSLSSLSTSSSLGNAISKGLENKFTYAYDALHGGFKVYISDFINTEHKDNQRIKVSVNKELENLRKNKINDEVSNNLLVGEFINFKNEYNWQLWY